MFFLLKMFAILLCPQQELSAAKAAGLSPKPNVEQLVF